MKRRRDGIVINERDNVATALDGLRAGGDALVEVAERVEKIRLVSDVPKGHKFALAGIDEGAPVVKYGEVIGRATAKIRRGEHVHVHNLASVPKGGKG